jgi:hypothetical protein
LPSWAQGRSDRRSVVHGVRDRIVFKHGRLHRLLKLLSWAYLNFGGVDRLFCVRSGPLRCG